jgi:outer membrane autotransporter protein
MLNPDGWFGDVSIGYSLPFGNGLEVVPSVGFTALDIDRDAITESGSSPFLLAVEDISHSAAIVDFGIRLARGEESGANLRPFVELGARHQFEGRDTGSIAALGGGPSTLLGVSPSRSPWVGRASAGLAADLSDKFSLNGAVTAEIGDKEQALSASAGVVFVF